MLVLRGETRPLTSLLYAMYISSRGGFMHLDYFLRSRSHILWEISWRQWKYCALGIFLVEGVLLISFICFALLLGFSTLFYSLRWFHFDEFWIVGISSFASYKRVLFIGNKSRRTTHVSSKNIYYNGIDYFLTFLLCTVVLCIVVRRWEPHLITRTCY